MNNYLFESFLDDKVVYKKNVTFWNSIIKSLFIQENISYSEYISTCDGYGNEFYDGNPICNFKIDNLNKAVKIVQNEPGDSQIKFSAWIIETELADNQLIDELVINIELTQETILVAIDLIHAWILSDLTKFRMKRYIETINSLRTQIKETQKVEFA
ncbi:MAG: hypothetical protein U9R19_12575 [Bacteroidota bacterium]|nr:hypothetical protein [Bacteroidota bacterium]